MSGDRAKRFQIESFFRDKEATPAPLTQKLVEGGHVQRNGGYIAYAHEIGIANPTQYWHLMESWAPRSKENATFGKSIHCGELVLWMTEVAEAIPFEDLKNLVDVVLQLHQELPYRQAYTQGNQLIQEACFESMTAKVLSQITE